MVVARKEVGEREKEKGREKIGLSFTDRKHKNRSKCRGKEFHFGMRASRNGPFNHWSCPPSRGSHRPDQGDT